MEREETIEMLKVISKDDDAKKALEFAQHNSFTMIYARVVGGLSDSEMEQKIMGVYESLKSEKKLQYG